MAITGLDKKSTHPLQLHAAKLFYRCIPHRSVIMPSQGDNDLEHLGMQPYNSFASWYEAAMGGLIPYGLSIEGSGYIQTAVT